MSEFSTKRFQLAIFLHASRALPYLRTDSASDGKLRFIFTDERLIGAQLELDFDRGAEVPARDLFSSQTFLRRQMSNAENQKTGECNHVDNPRELPRS